MFDSELKKIIEKELFERNFSDFSSKKFLQSEREQFIEEVKSFSLEIVSEIFPRTLGS